MTWYARELSIAVSNDLGSGIIRVKATSPMPEAAAAWANALAAELVADIDNQQSLAEAAAAEAETADPAGLPTTNIEQVDAPLVRVDLVDSAAVPTSPSGNPLTLLVGTATIGIIAAVLTSIVVARVRRSRDVEAEVWSHLDSPVLSELPAAGSSPKQWVAADGSATNPALVESIQRLRANVELALDRQLDATIGVVAARSSDDTSAVVMALGRSFADLGRSVGLIDADLRRPSLDRVPADGRPQGWAISTVPTPPELSVASVRLWSCSRRARLNVIRLRWFLTCCHAPSR